jgi:hypothetical protein
MMLLLASSGIVSSSTFLLVNLPSSGSASLSKFLLVKATGVRGAQSRRWTIVIGTSPGMRSAYIGCGDCGAKDS